MVVFTTVEEQVGEKAKAGCKRFATNKFVPLRRLKELYHVFVRLWSVGDC